MQKNEADRTNSVVPKVLSHLELLNILAAERGWDQKSTDYRSIKSHLKAWCSFCDKTLESPGFETLSSGVAPRLAAFTESKAADNKRNVKNLRWVVTDVKRIYDSLQADDKLPADFTGALNALMDAAGWKIGDLLGAMDAHKYGANENKGSSVRALVQGTTNPMAGRRGSRELVALLETTFGVATGTLGKRAFKDGGVIQLGTTKAIAYRDAQSKRSQFPYALKELPAQLEPWWKDVVYWRSQPYLMVKGERFAHKAGTYWKKPQTAGKYKFNLLRYLGWMTLPLPTKPAYEMTQDDFWSTGKGMKQEDITVAHVLDLQLFWEFLEFLRLRQHNQVFTFEHKHFLIFLNSLVNAPYSYFKAHPAWAPVFGQDAAGWVDFVEAKLHQPLLKMSRDLTKMISTEKQRDSDDPLATVYKDHDPMVLLTEMVTRMKADLAPRTQKQRRAAQLRDIAMFQMELEVPLRAENMSFMFLDKHLERDKVTGLWHLFVPKAELKNADSAHAHDIDRTYSQETSLDIDRYVNEGRPMLRGHDENRLFLLTTASGPKRKRSWRHSCYEINAMSLYNVISLRVMKYFGIGVGANLFRHLNATAALKDNRGNVEVAAAILNNAPGTIRTTYSHMTQADDLRKADALIAKRAANHQARFGAGPR